MQQTYFIRDKFDEAILKDLRKHLWKNVNGRMDQRLMPLIGAMYRHDISKKGRFIVKQVENQRDKRAQVNVENMSNTEKLCQ